MSTSTILRDAAALVRDPETAEKLLRWANTIDACSPQRQQAVLAALASQEIALGVLMPDLFERSRILSAATPYRLPEHRFAISARLVLGETPAQITGLTKAEAHAYMSDRRYGVGIYTPAQWLVHMYRVQEDLTQEAYIHDRQFFTREIRTVKIARWIISVMDDPARLAALMRTRSERGAHGEIIEGSFGSRLDELRDVDLRDSVEETFERAARRMWKASERAMAKKQEPLAAVPRWWKPARCAKLLLSGADLIAEGRDMHHCAATYAGYVAHGDSMIVSLRVPFCDRRLLPRDRPLLFHRSTVELDRRTLAVRQHKGPGNAEPHAVCKAALAVLLRRWGRTDGCWVEWGKFGDLAGSADDELPF